MPHEPGTRAKTWDDVRKAALHDPFLQACVRIVDMGMPKEDALIGCVIALSEARTNMHNELLKMLEGRSK